MTDAELVRRARTGEGQALAELMSRWAPKALALCHVHANREAAADLAQESLLRSLKNLSQLKNPEYFGPWLRSIVKRTCFDWLSAKRRAMIPFSALERETMEVPDTRNNSHHERLSELHQALAELPVEYREVVQLYYASKMTYQELGQLLDVSAATINARLTKARAILRERCVTPVETSL